MTERNLILQRAAGFIRIEAEALEATAAALDDRFPAVLEKVESTLQAGRKLIFAGLGKSGHIAEKLVGTFNSLGASSCFLDPVRALHGDLGLCHRGDLALVFSNSGETEETVRLVPLLRRLGLVTVAVCSREDSSLATAADALLAYRVPREACPLGLTPTASTTAALALGDALALCLMQGRAFSKEDFARLHPAGNLGHTLLLRTSDLMRTGDKFPCLPATCTIREAIVAMTRAKAGSIALTDPDSGRLAGILTDGDLRRHLLEDANLLDRRAEALMTRTPITVPANALAIEALRLFEGRNIDDLLVVDDERRPVGLIDGQDLPRLGLV